MTHEEQPLMRSDITSWLVGPYGPEGTGLEEWQLPFHNIALEGIKRATGLSQIPPEWSPDPAMALDLYEQLRYERTLHGMMYGLRKYVRERPADRVISKFRDNQIDMAETFADALINMSVGEPVHLGLKSPTGTGKTAVIVGVTEGLKYAEKGREEVGVLILVPLRDLVEQTCGAFKQYGSRIRPTRYFSDSKDLSPVTVMTYQSFIGAYESGSLRSLKIDAVVCDESHMSRGDKTARSLRAFCQASRGNKPLVVFEMSATPKGGELIYEETVVESIGNGLLSPAAARRVYTGSSIMERPTRIEHMDFATDEVRGLIDDPHRNKMIVDEVLSGLASGRRVIVRCLPGDNLRHTTII